MIAKFVTEFGDKFGAEFVTKKHWAPTSKKLGVDLLGEGVDLLGDDVDLLGDGVDLLGNGGDPRSIAVGSSKATVAQKGDQRLEIRKCDGPTLLLTNFTNLHG